MRLVYSLCLTALVTACGAHSENEELAAINLCRITGTETNPRIDQQTFYADNKSGIIEQLIKDGYEDCSLDKFHPERKP